MDFSVLSRYDDMLASYFVDGLYLWYNTLRMNSDFVETTINKQEVVDVIRKHVVEEGFTNKAVKDAADSFMKMPYFKEYLNGLPKKQVTEFTQHMRRYLFMYRSNAGFEVGSTTRYTGNPEACILATKDWKAGEQVTCCLGSIAALSEQDDLKLKREGRDFSVMVSTRKKCSCLFLGPARFMNHDCDSNCEFILIGQNAITFRVIKDIAQGEEMTAFYAEHYFGENNCECLCFSCERLQQGHFSVPSSEDATITENSDSEITTPLLENMSNNRRSGRKRKEISYKDYYVPEQIKKVRPNSNSEISNKRQPPAPLIEITNTDVENNSEAIDNTSFFMNKKQLFFEQGIITEFKDSQLQPTDAWIYMPAEADPKTYVRTNDQFNLISGAQHWGRKQSIIQEGEHILLANPQLAPHAFAPIPNQLTNESNFSANPTDYLCVKNEMDEVYDWIDDLSELSDDEKANMEYRKQTPHKKYDPHKLKCCPQAKEYCMSRVSENPELCGRCNRHFQIYGLHWPIRKIRKPTWRTKNKGLAKQVKSTLSPVPEIKNIKIEDQFISSFRVQSQSPGQNRSKNTSYNRTAIQSRCIRAQQNHRIPSKTEQKPTKLAVSYDSSPVVICAWPSNLSIPTIHNNNLPLDHREQERALALGVDRIQADNKKRRKVYDPIWLDRDIEMKENRIQDLTSKKSRLLELTSRLEKEILLQQMPLISEPIQLNTVENVEISQRKSNQIISHHSHSKYVKTSNIPPIHQPSMKMSFLLQSDPIEDKVNNSRKLSIEKDSRTKLSQQLTDKKPWSTTPPIHRSRNPANRKSRKGCPIAPPSKEPHSVNSVIVNKKVVNDVFRDPPPPRTLPPLSSNNNEPVSSSRRCSTSSNIGPFVPIEYNNC